jgi:hypothetical protein
MRLVRFDLTAHIRLTDDNIRRGMTPVLSNCSRIARLTSRLLECATDRVARETLHGRRSQ